MSGAIRVKLCVRAAIGAVNLHRLFIYIYQTQLPANTVIASRRELRIN